MKNIFFFFIVHIIIAPTIYAQDASTQAKLKQAVSSLIDLYSQAREKKDTVLLKSILTADVDQLVSSGEWRNGLGESVKGMVRSSESNAGTRKLIIDKIRFLSSESAIVDCRYEIQNPNGASRKMWSTFIVMYSGDRWKISAIRNMLPTGQQ